MPTTVYLIARRRTCLAAAKARLEYLGRDGLPWSRSRGQAVRFRNRDHAQEFIDSFPEDLAFAFVIWDQATEQREGDRT